MKQPPAPLLSRGSARPARLGLALSLTLLSASLLGGCKRPTGAAPQVNPTNDPAAPVRVATAAAAAREVPDVLAATGSLTADMQSEVTALVPGRVMAVLVERGQHVRQNDVLVRLRDVDFRTTAAQAQATLGQARARLGLEGGHAFSPEETAEVRAAAAQRDLADDGVRRAEQLYGTRSISDQELERARIQARAAQEQYRSAVNGARGAYFAYQQAQAVATQAGRALEDSVVRAPFDGEVAERKVNVGEYVTTQRAVVTLVRTDPLRIEILVPQERIAALRPNQPVELRVDAFPGRSFPGVIRYISSSVRPETRALVAEAVVPNGDGVLRPGLFATARIALGTRRPVVAVPARAVLSEAGTNRAFVVVNGRVQERVVTVADRGTDEVLVESGVAAGEHVATENLTRLGDGVQVVEQ